MKEVFIVVQHSGGLDQLVRSNVAAFLTREAAEGHIEEQGNKELPNTGGLLKYAVRPIGLYEDHEEWVEDVITKARVILEEGL